MHCAPVLAQTLVREHGAVICVYEKASATRGGCAGMQKLKEIVICSVRRIFYAMHLGKGVILNPSFFPVLLCVAVLAGAFVQAAEHFAVWLAYCFLQP